MRVLVVEDDAALVAALREGLSARGFAVDVASTAQDAQRLLDESSCDLMLLDLGLPDGDGLDFLRALRARKNALPVLVLTAQGDVDARVRGLDAGADDYLYKPFAFPELVARLRALLRRGGPTVPTVMRVADVELDPARFEVRRAGLPVIVTAKEFAILEYFMRHEGELVTRTMLLEHCWDDSYEGLSNLVDVHVSRIRRKLEASGRGPILHTIRGVGFLLGDRPR
jgi:two-component system OmpR family response regulator